MTDPLGPGGDMSASQPGAGDDLCSDCSGSGRSDGRECPTCGGSGVVTEPISGA